MPPLLSYWLCRQHLSIWWIVPSLKTFFSWLGRRLMRSWISPFFTGPFSISFAHPPLPFDLQMLVHPKTWSWVPFLLYLFLLVIPWSSMQSFYITSTLHSRLEPTGFTTWSQDSRGGGRVTSYLQLPGTQHNSSFIQKRSSVERNGKSHTSLQGF